MSITERRGNTVKGLVEKHSKNILSVLDGKALSTREIVNVLGHNWREDGKFMGEISQVVSAMEEWAGKKPSLKVAIDLSLKPEHPRTVYHPYAIKYYRADQEEDLIKKGLLSKQVKRVSPSKLLKEYRPPQGRPGIITLFGKPKG